MVPRILPAQTVVNSKRQQKKNGDGGKTRPAVSFRDMLVTAVDKPDSKV